MENTLKYVIGFGMLHGDSYQEIAAAVRFNLFWYFLEGALLPAMILGFIYFDFRDPSISGQIAMLWVIAMFGWTLFFIRATKYSVFIIAEKIQESGKFEYITNISTHMSITLFVASMLWLGVLGSVVWLHSLPIIFALLLPPLLIWAVIFVGSMVATMLYSIVDQEMVDAPLNIPQPRNKSQLVWTVIIGVMTLYGAIQFMIDFNII